jgi:hypothetical protein
MIFKRCFEFGEAARRACARSNSSTRTAAAPVSASAKARRKSVNSKAAAELVFPATEWLQVLDKAPVKLFAE